MNRETSIGREQFCERVVDNIDTIYRELNALRRQVDSLTDRIEYLQQQREAAVRDANDPTSQVGRLPKRRDRVGFGRDVITAIGQVLTDDSGRKLQAVEAHISNTQR